jgi:acetylornithine/N-succinyldiaminopimelate aminotransferase
LEVLESENLMQNAKKMSTYFTEKAKSIPQLKQLKGRGLMLGLEFNFPVASLRKKLLFDHFLFTGSSKNPNLIRILPPLTIKKEHIDLFFKALAQKL